MSRAVRIEVTAVAMIQGRVLRVTDDATREQIAEAIAALRAKMLRMPAHWVDRRQEVADEIDELVTEWLEAEA